MPGLPVHHQLLELAQTHVDQVGDAIQPSHPLSSLLLLSSIYMQSTSCKMPVWINHKLESRLLGEISTISGRQMIPLLMAENEDELKSLLMRAKEESKKAGLKLTFQKKTKVVASSPITSWQIEGEKWKQ